MIRAALLILALAGPAAADTVVAAHTIRAKTLLTHSDLAIAPGTTPGTLDDPDLLVGQEARVTLYAGRPVRLGDVGPPALVERNQIVTMVFATPALTISTDARALDRAGAGDRIRAMNLASRTTITGTVTEDGRIFVNGGYQ